MSKTSGSRDRKRSTKESKRAKSKKPQTKVRTMELVTSKAIKESPEGARKALEEIGVLGFFVPAKPSKNMDELFERFEFPAVLSEIQPFDRVRDLLGFYTSEAGRANVEVRKHRAHLRHLKRGRDNLMRRLMRDLPKGTPKWRAQSEAESSKRLRGLEDEIAVTESIIEITDALAEDYGRKADALSREITSRRDEWERNSRNKAT